MEKSLIGELTSARGTLRDEKAFEMRVSSDMRVIKESFDKSTDISTIKRVVFSKIENITKAMKEKEEQDMLRFQETVKTLKKMSKKMSSIVNETQVMKKKSLEAELESYHDNLTQLYNRKAYDKMAKEMLADLDRYDASASLLFFDIDYFKKINDTFGHHAGDLTLKKFAQILKEKLRINDFISRYGGDEFVCILPYIEMEEAIKVAEKIRSFVDKTSFTFKGKEVPVTMSAGISTFKKQDDVLTVFERADAALYLAKHSGRNRIKTEDDIDNSGNIIGRDSLSEMNFYKE
jgi:diguanylate cyclase (GGDEF)-like protein